ncbi:MAG: hypothetical protein ACRDNG_12370 [Gaiellaceae bacterium]
MAGAEPVIGAEPWSDLRARAEHHLRASIGCSLAVTLKAPGTVTRSEGGKRQRVLDRRTLV